MTTNYYNDFLHFYKKYEQTILLLFVAFTFYVNSYIYICIFFSTLFCKVALETNIKYSITFESHNFNSGNNATEKINEEDEEEDEDEEEEDDYDVDDEEKVEENNDVEKIVEENVNEDVLKEKLKLEIIPEDNFKSIFE